MRPSAPIVVGRDENKASIDVEVWARPSATDFVQATADFLSKGLSELRAALGALPTNEPADALRDLAVKLETALKGWESQAPTEPERAGLVRKLLALRRAVSRLEK